MISFKNQTITVLRPTFVVERGDEVPDWSNPTQHLITGCRLQPMSADEVLFSGAGGGGTARNAVVSRWKLLLPSGADITEHDRVRYADAVYEVDGFVQHWPSPTGALAHGEAVLRRVEG